MRKSADSGLALSPKRIWRRFRQNRLSFFALISLSVILLVSLAAPLIANDKPLLVRYQKHWFFPLLVQYPETTFGGELPTQTDYHDPQVSRMINEQGFMIHPPLIFGEKSLVMNSPTPHPTKPNRQNLLGTDDVGRDVAARLLYALRTSLVFGLALSLASALLGLVFGGLMGYLGGVFDLLGQRFLELWLGLPQLFVMMIITSLFTPSLGILFLLLLLFGWTSLVPIIRLSVLRSRQLPFVLAAKNLGVAPIKVFYRHILPGLMTVVLAQMPFMVAANISALTTLDFLGFGLPVGSASLGELLMQGKNHLDAPHLVLSGFLALALILSLCILIGEGLRQAIDDK